MTPGEQLDGFIAKYSPEIQAQGRLVLRKMRDRLPGAVELVYDNYNALVCGFGPSERASEAIFSIAFYPRYVTLFFLQGAGLPDPDGLLKGEGKVARQLRLSNPADLDRPDVQRLLQTALDHAAVPFDPAQPYRLVIKSVSAKQRPRLPKDG